LDEYYLVNMEELKKVALEVFNDFETEGCDGCGTVSTEAMGKLRIVLIAVGMIKV